MTKSFGICVLLIGLLLGGTHGAAEEPADEEDARARAVVARAVERLAGAERLRVRVRVAWDVVQEDGAKLEFGAERTLLLRRPDRMRVDAVSREGERTVAYVDGKRATLHSPDQNVYSTIEVPPSLEQALDALDEAGVPTQLGDLFRKDLQARLDTRVRETFWVEKETLDGEPCEHVVLRGEDTDIQLWVTSGADARIRRVVIDYLDDEASPGFRADLYDWDFAPATPDELFAFQAPVGAEAVPFVRIGRPKSERSPQ